MPPSSHQALTMLALQKDNTPSAPSKHLSGRGTNCKHVPEHSLRLYCWLFLPLDSIDHSAEGDISYSCIQIGITLENVRTGCYYHVHFWRYCSKQVEHHWFMHIASWSKLWVLLLKLGLDWVLEMVLVLVKVLVLMSVFGIGVGVGIRKCVGVSVGVNFGDISRRWYSHLLEKSLGSVDCTY